MENKVALGFSNFIDKIIEFDPVALESFLADIRLYSIKVNGVDFKECFVKHLRGQNGKEYSVDKAFFQIIEDHFKFKRVVGGTSARIALFLDSLGIDSLLHINVIDELLANSFRNQKVSLQLPEQAAERIHYIFELRKGDQVAVDGAAIEIVKTDRIIFVDKDEVPIFPLAAGFFDAIDQNTKMLFFCSINTAKDDEYLSDFARVYVPNFVQLKTRLPELLLFFEDCGHHDLRYKDKLMKSLAGKIDIYSCNEEEIYDFNHVFSYAEPGFDLVVRLMDSISGRYDIPTVIVHTKDYVLVRGNVCEWIGKAVEIGILSASHWYKTGSSPAIQHFKELNKLPLNAKYVSRTLPDGFYLFPTRRIDTGDGFTLGLGDCFAGGMIASFLRPDLLKSNI